MQQGGKNLISTGSTTIARAKVGGDGDDEKDPKKSKYYGPKDKVPKERKPSKEEEEKTPEKPIQHTLTSTSRVGAPSHSLIPFSIAL